MAINWKKEREEKLKKIHKSMEGLGKGLYSPQVEVNVTPWINTWELTGMMLERQEEIIRLLEDIKILLEGKKPIQAKKNGAVNARIKKKIDSADYNTLRGMCKSLGLTANGKKDELKKRLYKHYKIR